MKFEQLRTMSLEQHHINNSQYVYTVSQTIIAETFNSESSNKLKLSYSNNHQTWASTNLSLSSVFMNGSKNISEVKPMRLLTVVVVLTDKSILWNLKWKYLCWIFSCTYSYLDWQIIAQQRTDFSRTPSAQYCRLGDRRSNKEW